MNLAVPIDVYRALLDHCLLQASHKGRRIKNRYLVRRRGARDAALLALAYTLGLSVTELLSLQRADYRQGFLSVQGRGGTRRQLPVLGSTRQILDLWAQRHDATTPNLFYSVTRPGSGARRQLSQKGLGYVIERTWVEAGMTGDAPNFRSLRNSFKALLKGHGASEAVVRSVMGLSPGRSSGAAPAASEVERVLERVAQAAAPGVRLPRS